MPLVTPGASVPIEFVGIDGVSAKTEEINKRLAYLRQRLDDAGKTSEAAAQKSTFSWTEFRSAYSTVIDVLRTGKQAWDATVGVTVDLANNVRQFRDVTGQTAEESSRLIQVLDDYKVSVGDAEKATKKMAKDGLEFNIDTLAKLSDEYLSLGSNVEKTKFLYDTFGKSGENFVEIMKQGGEAILAANDAINENLILTDKQLKDAREYEIALDELNDRILSQKVLIGNELIPTASTMLELYSRTQETIESGEQTYTRAALYTSALKIQQENLTERIREAATARMEGLASIYETTTALEGQAEATYDLTTSNEEFLGMVESTSGRITSFEEKQSDLLVKRKDLEAEKQELIRQGWWEESEKVQDINAKIDENIAKYQENADAFEIENKRIMLGYIERKLAADGVLDDAELLWLTEKGVAWGVYHETAVAEVTAMVNEANALIAGIVTEKTFTLSLNTLYSQYGDSAAIAGSGARRASGGPVSAGQSYLVGEKGMEMFTPNQNGYITPHDKIATTGGMVVNIMLDSATPDPERVAYNLRPAVERVLRDLGK